MVNYASQRTVHFLHEGVLGKCSFTIWKLNPLLGALLLAEEGEKKPAGSLFRHFREKWFRPVPTNPLSACTGMKQLIHRKIS